MKQISKLIFGALLLFSINANAYRYTIPASLCVGFDNDARITWNSIEPAFLNQPPDFVTVTCPIYKFNTTTNVTNVQFEYYNLDRGYAGGVCRVFARSHTGTIETSSPAVIPATELTGGFLEIANLPQPSSSSIFSLNCTIGGWIRSIRIEE